MQIPNQTKIESGFVKNVCISLLIWKSGEMKKLAGHIVVKCTRAERVSDAKVTLNLTYPIKGVSYEMHS